MGGQAVDAVSRLVWESRILLPVLSDPDAWPRAAMPQAVILCKTALFLVWP